MRKSSPENQAGRICRTLPLTSLCSPAAVLGALLLLLASGASADCSGTAPCRQPSPAQTEQLLGMIEQVYPTLFSNGSSLQVYPDATGDGYFRRYGANGALAVGTYQGALWYSLGSGWQRYGALDDANAEFCAGTCFGPPLTSAAFRGNLVLGSPTRESVRLNVFSAEQSGQVYAVYGSEPGRYLQRSASLPLQASEGSELLLAGLRPDTRYYYRLYFRDAAGREAGLTPEYSFHTQRAAGSSFTFALQGDSHPERERSQFDGRLYTRTLQTVAADRPDFYILMGDDFSVDTLNPATITQAQVKARYTLQRPYLGQLANSAPLFLVNGNHEQSARYLLNGTPDSVAVWAQNARNSLYAQPAPDGFYSGNPELVPFIGPLRNYFAWTWGDALFVVIDFYWGSDVCVDNSFFDDNKRSNLWDVTLGPAQYAWLKQTLEQSKAKFKFVMAHHVLGTGRGGIEAALKYEWGGLNGDGRSSGFAANRPGLPTPIHRLLVDNGVDIFFQAHDHIWVRQQLDGVTYQTLSEPADPNYSLFNSAAFTSGVQFPNTGYTRVRVSDREVKVEYVRTYLPEHESSDKVSGQVVYSYSLQ